MSNFLSFIILLIAGWINRLQVAQIGYLKEEVCVLREHMPEKRSRVLCRPPPSQECGLQNAYEGIHCRNKKARVMPSRNEVLQQALILLADSCPRLVSACYWAGTASISIEELHHRESFDLDFHTREALFDVRPIFTEMQSVFGSDFEVVHAPDPFGSGFLGVLTLPSGDQVNIEVLSNYEDAQSVDLVPSTSVCGLQRVSLARYLADKIQCVVERCESRDLVDIRALLSAHPEMEAAAKRLLAEQDALILAERLLAWTDVDIEEDLRSYGDASPEDAVSARDLLLSWTKAQGMDDGAVS